MLRRDTIPNPPVSRGTPASTDAIGTIPQAGDRGKPGPSAAARPPIQEPKDKINHVASMLIA
jgi:hypothetical protein